jgi:hypothetical protein
VAFYAAAAWAAVGLIVLALFELQRLILGI